LLQLTASERDATVSRDIDHPTSLATGEQVRAKIVCELLTSERDYVKLLRDIIEVGLYRTRSDLFYKKN